MKLSLIQRIKLLLFGKVRLDEYYMGLQLYAFRCPEHGLVTGYPIGYGNKLICGKCIEKLCIKPF